jgi:hypothetical protein
MSDVFSRTISRATGATSAVEPILTSRYEAPATTEIPSLDQPTEMESTPVVPPRLPHVRRSGQVAQPETQHAAPARADVRAAEAPDPRRTPPVEEFEFGEATSTVSHTLPPRAADANLPRLEARDDQSLTLRAEDHAREGHEKESRGEGGDIQVRAVVKSDEVIRETLHHDRTVLVVRSGTDPVRDHDMTTEASSGLSSAPAEVNVTIGAIEVRLAAPANPPSRKAAPPRVSLDDYLRRRNGGPR